jgi:hypothetical protein
MPTEDTAAAVIVARQREAAAATLPVVTEALIAATGYAIAEIRDYAEPGPGDLRRLLSSIAARWPVLDATDRSWCVGYASGAVAERDRLLAQMPTAGARQ